MTALETIPYQQFHVKQVEKVKSHRTKSISFKSSVLYPFQQYRSLPKTTAGKKYNCTSPHSCKPQNSFKFLVPMFNEKYPGIEIRKPEFQSKFSLKRESHTEMTSHVLGLSVSTSKMGNESLCLSPRVVLGPTQGGMPVCSLYTVKLSCTKALSHPRSSAHRAHWTLEKRIQFARIGQT